MPTFAPQQPNLNRADCLAQRACELMRELGIEVLAIEDYPYEKLCTLRFGQYQFRLVVLHDDAGSIVHVHCFGIGTKASQARDAMERLVGLNLNNLPPLNADRLMSSSQALSEIAINSKGQVMNVGERVAMILHSFDPAFEINELEPKQFNQAFEVVKPNHFEFLIRIYHKKDQRISSVFARLSEESEARPGSECYFPLIEEIKRACAISMIGTGVQILVAPNSAKVNSKHILEVQPAI